MVLPPTAVAFIFLIVIAVLLLLIAGVTDGQGKDSTVVVEKPYKLTTEDEVKFQREYLDALKKYEERTFSVVGTSGTWVDKGRTVDAMLEREKTYKLAQRPMSISSGVGKFCCAPLLFREDGVEIAARSSYFSCQPCHKIRPWCPTATTKSTCDSKYCKWHNNRCRAYDRPVAVNSIFCEPNGAIACYDYDQFPTLSNAEGENTSPAPAR